MTPRDALDTGDEHGGNVTDEPGRPRVSAIMTVFNRVEMTMACLRALHDQDALERVDLEVVLVDDGSTDGTRERVAAEFPDVRLLIGDGQRFWNGGMRMAWADALERDPDFTLWLNDDTTLRRGALRMLLDTYAELAARTPPDVDAVDPPVIVAGATVDPASGAVNYSGVRKERLRALRFQVVQPDGRPRRVDTMNGNAVLIPRCVVLRLGSLARAYTHSMGDYDYGLRARLAGCEVWTTPEVIGECGSNPGFRTSGDVQGDWARLRSTKHLPIDEWQVFARRWGGVLWPLYWLSPYVRRSGWILRGALGRTPS